MNENTELLIADMQKMTKRELVSLCAELRDDRDRYRRLGMGDHNLEDLLEIKENDLEIDRLKHRIVDLGEMWRRERDNRRRADKLIVEYEAAILESYQQVNPLQLLVDAGNRIAAREEYEHTCQECGGPT